MLTLDRMRLLGESGGLLVRKGGESGVESRDFQDCSPRLYRIRTDRLTPVRKY
jgi:hypothetical protein